MSGSVRRRCNWCDAEMGEQQSRIAGDFLSDDGAFRIVYYCPNENCPAITDGLTPGFVIIVTPEGEMTEDEWYDRVQAEGRA